MRQYPNNGTKLNRVLKYIIALVGILMVLWWLVIPKIRAAQFCTKNDEVYQAILANINIWRNHFPNYREPTLSFKTASGQEYMVNAKYWETKDQSPIFFIPTVPKTRELLGYAGYAYSPAGMARPDGRYTSEYLSDNIYCYRFKS